MKFLKSILVAGLLASLFVTGSAPLSSCKKEIIRDTIIKRDTIRIIDSVCYDLKDGLVAWYKFTGGSLKDSSGKNNDIVFNNATPTADRFGKPNNAFLFNGNGNYMSVKNSVSLNPAKALSIMAIIKVNDFYTGACHANNIVSKGWNDFVNGFYTLRYTDLGTDCSAPVDITKERFYGAYGDNNNNRAGAGSTTSFISKGKWINVIYTFGNGTSNMYVDGVLLDSRVQQNPSFAPNSLDLTIGKHGDPQYPYYVNGIIDEIRIYEKALCEGEIKLLNKLTD
jgi:hypothetical protein